MTPSYAPGCKRIAKSEVYLQALAQPNVTVVPVAVQETQGDLIIDAKGNKEKVDILVLATGYDTAGFLGNLDSKYISLLYIYIHIIDNLF